MTNAPTTAQPKKRFYVYPLQDAFIWLDTEDHQVCVTNAVGVLVLTHKNKSLEYITKAICSKYDVKPEKAAHDAQQILEEVEQRQQEDDAGNYLRYEPVTDYVPDRNCQAKARSHLYLPNFTITVRSELADLPDFLNPLFQLTEQISPTSEKLTLDVFDEGETFPVVFNGKTVETGFSVSDTAVKCLREINTIVAAQFPFLMKIHASAVATGNCALLFPATSGSGKSTLSAYLISRGYKLINDDTVSLLDDTRQMLPIPLSLSTKTGAWPILDEYFPVLKDLYQHEYGDRHVKYLPVYDHQVCTTPVDCRFIILPRYSPDYEQASIAEISPLTVFQHFTTSGCTIKKPIDPVQLGALVEWTSKIPCYRLHYSSLEHAATAIDSLVATVTTPPVRQEQG
ncbi:MAG: hypothetical protein AB8B97_07245 [Granulosicoccus sp.]